MLARIVYHMVTNQQEYDALGLGREKHPRTRWQARRQTMSTAATMASQLLHVRRGGQVMKTMMSFLVPMTALGLALASSLQAQNDTNKGDSPNQPKTVTVAGCLTQSETPGI